MNKNYPACNMSVRDYFAGQVIAEILKTIWSCVSISGVDDDDTAFKIASQKAYALADAMIKEGK